MKYYADLKADEQADRITITIDNRQQAIFYL